MQIAQKAQQAQVHTQKLAFGIRNTRHIYRLVAEGDSC